MIFDVFSGSDWNQLCNFLDVDNPHPDEKFLWKNKMADKNDR